MQAGAKLEFVLLLTPLLLWPALLIIIPHIELFLISIGERVAARTHETGFAHYLTFAGNRCIR